MKQIKITLSIILSVITFLYSHGQTGGGIFEGDITLTTQAEVDAFSYTEVTGMLTISGDDISNLNSLSQLTRAGNLILRANASLVDVSGLAALSEVYSVDVSDNPLLPNLDPLSSVTLARDGISIRNNASLESINGFSLLAGDVRAITISGNPQLKSVNGFQSLTRLLSYDGGDLMIDNNASLMTIDGLSSLSGIYGKSGSIQITNNAALLNIDGLSSFQTFVCTGTYLNISNNTSLKNLDGLSSFSQMGTDDIGTILIENNAALENIDGLAQLRTAFDLFSQYSIIRIKDNPSLSQCDGVKPLLVSMGGEVVAELIQNGNIEVSGNDSGCTLEEIIAGISQSIYAFSLIDENGDSRIRSFDSVTVDLGNPYYLNNAVQAKTFPSPVGSVLFIIDNQLEIVDNDYPYAVSLATLGAGIHHVTCELYSLADKQGEKGTGKSFVINILNTPQICDGTVILSSQAEVDAFSCTELIGHLTISGSDITDLKNLSLLTKVSGSLNIVDNPNLERLDGLSGLATVGGIVRIQSNHVLSNFDALNSLKRVGGLFISGNPALLDIGLSSFQSLEDGGELHINGNENLHAISGFSKVTVAGPIEISNNPKLESISAFDILVMTKNDLYNGPGTISIYQNDVLTNLDCFKALATVGAIRISMNNQLTALDGFLSVTKLYGELEISSNALLKSVNGFQKLTRMSSISREVTDVGIVISNNPFLESFTGLSSIETIYSQYRNRVDISNNPSLKNLDGLSSLVSIIGEFTLSFQIKNNATLENIDGLSALKEVGAYLNDLNFTITQNPLLTQCCVLSPLLAWMDERYHLDTMIAGGHLLIAENGGCTVEDIISCGPQKISQLQVIDLRTGQDVQFFYRDSVTLDLVNPNFSYLGIQARTFPMTVGSVEFRVNEVRHTENNLPYIFDLPRLDPGTYNIETDVYSKSNKQGVKGIGKTATIIVKNSAAVESYELVDAIGRPIRPLSEGDRINIKDVVFSKSVNIRANVSGNQITSVRFFLNGVFVRREMSAPFAFNGDNNGNYYPWKPQPGDYTLLAVPYVVRNNKEYEGKSLEINFTVEEQESPIAVESFDVVDTFGNILKQLNEGDQINIQDPMFKAINIVANTSGQVGSVNFWLNNKSYRTENGVPYTLAGDQNGKFNAWSPGVGDYKLTAIPHSESNAKGTVGGSLTVHFKVVNENMTSATRLVTSTGLNEEPLFQEGLGGVSIYPVPVGNALNVKIDDAAAGKDATLTIVNFQGLMLYKNSYAESQTINTLELKPGVYMLQIVSNSGFRRVVKFIKK